MPAGDAGDRIIEFFPAELAGCALLNLLEVSLD